MTRRCRTRRSAPRWASPVASIGPNAGCCLENAAPSPSRRRSESTPAIAWREPTIRRLQAHRTGRAGPRAKIPASLSVPAGRRRSPCDHGHATPPSLRRISPSMPPVIEDGGRVASHTQKISATLRVRRSPAGRSRILSSWTGSLGPRAWIHDHGDRQKSTSDLQILRAAYRNRTDDLRITRRIRVVHGCPRNHVCPARVASQSARVRDGPGSLLANPLARSIRAAAPTAAHPGRTAPDRPPGPHARRLCGRRCRP